MPRVLIFILPILLALYALIECATTDSEKMPYQLPKPMWFMIILLFAFIGPLAWIVLLRIERAEAGESAPSPKEVVKKIEKLRNSTRDSKRPQNPQPLGPDDDPEYLARLERQLQREKIERERQQRRVEELRRAREDENTQADDSSSKDSKTPEEDLGN
ncbi:PLDc N-terminal domain-containing protein [Actinomycetaceae bacterium TAE3-ERU4]|nr:PLDc N-terminal domain-containing protein [Actinomycetaceae bacterium TAE3-ERU4]